MAAGKLYLSTDYAGTISIEWREIVQIESRYLCEVRLDEGERLLGRFVAGISPISSPFGHENAPSLGQKVYSVRPSVCPSKLRGLCASPRDGSEPHWPESPASLQIAANSYTDR